MKNILLNLSINERAAFEEFARNHDLSITEAIEKLALTIIKSNYKPMAKDNNYNIQCRLNERIHKMLKNKSKSTGVSMKDMLLEALYKSV